MAEVSTRQSQERFLGTGGVRGSGRITSQQLTGVSISELNSVIVPTMATSHSATV